LVFTIDALTAQRWVDTGLGGLAMGSIDNGDGNGRFNLTPIVADNGATSIAFNVVPEPNVGWLGALVMLFVAFRRSRS
jgi:hypothetical protein